MIIGTQLRYIKTYVGINYIPISSGDSFCGLIGINGIGKSSVLEALDCFFNKREWNYNISTKKSGFSTTLPSIVPIFLLKKERLQEGVRDIAEKMSTVLWDCTEEDILSRNRRHFEVFKNQRESLLEKFNKDEYYLLSIGDNHEKHCSIGIFDTKKIGKKIFTEDSIEDQLTLIDDSLLSKLEPLREEIKAIYDYIYIPNDITLAEFTRLETVEIQNLMGESLAEILRRTVPGTKITEINQKLNEFLDELSSKLEHYSFRTPTDRQQNLRKADVYSMITSAFFNIRKLHKKEGEQWLELGQLSSGEQQAAMIEVASRLLANYRSSTENLIISIDEPESSLHMSACFDQFERLFQMSRKCSQLLFATHWYGFIPTSERGNVTIINKGPSNHNFDLIDLYDYREKIKQQIRDSRGNLPYDVRIKGLNDFLQSIAVSIIKEEPYNWLICEGSSEKIYFEKYLKEEVEELNLRIIPVGGASEIKRIFLRLLVTFEEFKPEIKGRVFLLSDTDAQLVKYESNNPYRNLKCQRMVNVSEAEGIKLINIEANPVSPATEIEDSLNGKLFIKTLQEFYGDYSDELSFLDSFDEVEELDSEKNSYFLLDLTRTQSEALTTFFDQDDNKMDFAKKYVELLESEEHHIPTWIREIKEFFRSNGHQ